jgi:hypothetical protein
MSFASSGESKSGGGGNVFLFIPPDCHHKKITQVGCGIKLTQSHKFAVNSSWVNSYLFFTCPFCMTYVKAITVHIRMSL